MTVSAEFKTASDISQSSNQSPRKKKNSNLNKKRPSPVTLRLTEAERQKLNELADGMTLSAYIRWCVFQKERKYTTPVKDKVEIAKILGLLGQSRIANNLNQLAHHANIGSLAVDDMTRQQLGEAYTYVNEIRVLLIKALGFTKTNQ